MMINNQQLRSVPLLLTIATVLIFFMASFSKINIHPDEHVHRYAAQYYENNIIPHKICDEKTKGSYSVYGYSRLDGNELVYPVTGLFLRVLKPLPLESFIKARYFNVFLFIVLVILAYRVVAFRWFALPLLISPQIWYIFSYYNSEGFAIFVCLISSFLLMNPYSSLNQWLEGKSKVSYLKNIVLVTLLIASLLLLKQTFYVFIFFIGLWFLTRCVLSQRWKIKRYVTKLIALFLMGLTLASAMIISHQIVNEFNVKEKIIACSEETARNEYKPSTPLEKTNHNLSLKSKGLDLLDVYEKGWLRKLYYSAFGYYGYFTVPGTHLYYNLISAGLIALLMCMIVAIKKSADKKKIVVLLFGLLCMCLFISVAFYRSWVVDFQPQGRYLFAMIPIIGSILFYFKSHLNQKILTVTILYMWLLSAYSFVFVGLSQLRMTFG